MPDSTPEPFVFFESVQIHLAVHATSWHQINHPKDADNAEPAMSLSKRISVVHLPCEVMSSLDCYGNDELLLLKQAQRANLRWRIWVHWCMWPVYIDVYVYTYIHACIHTYTHTYKHRIRACFHTRIHTRVYICMPFYMHKCTRTHAYLSIRLSFHSFPHSLFFLCLTLFTSLFSSSSLSSSRQDDIIDIICICLFFLFFFRLSNFSCSDEFPLFLVLHVVFSPFFIVLYCIVLYCIVLYLSIYIAPLNSHGQTEAGRCLWKH